MTIRPLTNELQEKSEKELNEKANRVEDDLKHIREWLQKQPHLTAREEDQFLVAFLRGCKFNIERTKEKLDFFYTMRNFAPEYLIHRDPLSAEVQEVLKLGAILPLKNTKGPLEPRILLLRWDVCKPETISLNAYIKTLFMIMDILINEDDYFVVAGMSLWVDFKDFSLRYILQYTPSAVKKIVLLLQNAYPLRLKGIHCTNTPYAFETIFHMAKAFMGKKIQQRMSLFNEENFVDVHEVIPSTIMPLEFGGDAESVNKLAGQWKDKVESYRDWFLEDARYHADEALREKNSESFNEIFGMAGSFRKLDID